MSEGERWRAIAGLEDAYEVSDLGRVRSLERLVESVNQYGPYTRRIRERIIRLDRQDILGGTVSVNLTHGGRKHRVWVAACVLTAFVSPRPTNQDARHRNQDFRDNRLTNLFWGPPPVPLRKPHSAHDTIVAARGMKSLSQTARENGVRPGTVRRLWRIKASAS